MFLNTTEFWIRLWYITACSQKTSNSKYHRWWSSNFRRKVMCTSSNIWKYWWRRSEMYNVKNTAWKMKFSIKDILSKCDQIRRKLRIRSHLLKKSLMENFIFLCSEKKAGWGSYLLNILLDVEKLWPLIAQ